MNWTPEVALTFPANGPPGNAGEQDCPLNGQVGANLRSTLLERFYKQVAMDSSSLLAGREMEWGIFFVEVCEHIGIAPELKKRVGGQPLFETLHHPPVGGLVRWQPQDLGPLGDVVGGLNSGTSSGEDAT